MNYEPHKKLTHLKNDMNIIIQMFLDNPGIILILQYFFFSKFSYLKISIVPIFLFITEGLPHDVLITFGILLIPSMIEIELLIEISTIVSKLEYLPPTSYRKIQPLYQISPQRIISQKALDMFTLGVSDNRTTQYAYYTPSKYNPDFTAKPIYIAHLYAPVTHPTTNELIYKYTTLKKDLEMKEVWKT